MPKASRASTCPVARAVTPDYLLRAGDELLVTILEEKDSARRIPVRPDGRISYDFVGDVQASGRSVTQVREEIEEKLRKLYVSPHVSVIGTTFTARVYVLGEVGTQRSVPFQEGMGLISVVAEVGGLSHKGKHNQVLVVRGGFDQPVVFEANYAQVVRGRQRDIPLLAGDIIFVPPTALTRLERISLQIVPFFQAVISAESAEESALAIGRPLPGQK